LRSITFIVETVSIKIPLAKIEKNGPNSPVRYPSRPFQPALKPILERFDFVKSSGFSPFPSLQRRRHIIARKKRAGPPSPEKPRHHSYQGERKNVLKNSQSDATNAK